MTHLELAISIARTAGDIMRRNFRRGMKTKLKADRTIVTETDIAINRLLIETIAKEFPDHDVLAEEECSLENKSDFVWVCDPVDGTVPFSMGIPTNVFSLAFTKRGEVLFGVVYDPYQDRMYVAEQGKGALLNQDTIRVSPRKQLEDSEIGMAFWRGADWDLRPLSNALEEAGAFVHRLGSITYMGALVASGEFDATLFPGRKSHDTAALKIIVEEAGGKVTSLFGDEQRYNGDIEGHLVSNGHMHDELLSLIRSTVARTKSKS